MFMGEFANKVRASAATAMRQVYRQDATPGMDPMLELIGCLLGNDTGSEAPPTDPSVTLEQWLIWNQLVMDREEELVEEMTRVLEWEEAELPCEPEAMRAWAAWLVLNSLDRMGML
jgi:hypothetical protein